MNSAGRPRIPGWVRIAGATVVVAVVVWFFLVPQVRSALSDTASIEGASPYFLSLAVVLELASWVCYTGLSRVVLGPRSPLSFDEQLRVDLTGNGLSHVLPGGGVVAATVRARMMTRRGVAVDDAVSMATIQTIFSILALFALAAVADVIALSRRGATVVTVIVIVLAAIGIAVAVGSVIALRVRSARGPRRAPRPATDAGPSALSRARVALAEIGESAVELATQPAWLRRGTAWAVLNWAFDAASLYACLRTFGVHLAPDLVLASYALALLLAFLPVTPGGLGIVEGVLVPSLVSVGGASAPVALSVLTWRLLEYFLPVPIGGLTWLSLAHERLRRASADRV